MIEQITNKVEITKKGLRRKHTRKRRRSKERIKNKRNLYNSYWESKIEIGKTKGSKGKYKRNERNVYNDVKEIKNNIKTEPYTARMKKEI